MLDKEKLGALIKEKRKEKKLTQLNISESTGLSRSYISDIEKGRYMPSAESLYKIASCIEMDLNLLRMTEIQVVEWFYW